MSIVIHLQTPLTPLLNQIIKNSLKTTQKIDIEQILSDFDMFGWSQVELVLPPKWIFTQIYCWTNFWAERIHCWTKRTLSKSKNNLKKTRESERHENLMRSKKGNPNLSLPKSGVAWGTKNAIVQWLILVWNQKIKKKKKNI